MMHGTLLLRLKQLLLDSLLQPFQFGHDQWLHIRHLLQLPLFRLRKRRLDLADQAIAF